MKYILTLTTLFVIKTAFVQTKLPDFLQGRWKMENKEVYEHWDRLNDQAMKGFSYSIKNGQVKVSEYLNIVRNSKSIIYTATVLNQNQGKEIEFKMTKADDIWVFENPLHDFPQKIVYQKISGNEIIVELSGSGQKKFSYKMIKQNPGDIQKDTTISNANYDKALAERLGADAYGMKGYLLVVLKTGPNKTTDKDLISESFRGHLANINRLVDEGKLIVAGPFGKNDNQYRGIFILNNVKTAEEAKELLQTDPAIANGLLEIEIYNWYGSAALPEYLPFSDKVWKQQP
ncbi:MAG: hypothetical protein KIT80_14525 [Chitinophagaceae bacterium]|nr:hypothetical protein [Chitinophagaceae bacterium]MCW5928129.1 hypothetical protein [Chitinophagaceae bacterium]